MLYEAEVSNLRQIKEELTSRVNRLTTDEIDRSHIVGKENAQLTTKCDLLSGELEELKNKMDLHRLDGTNKFCRLLPITWSPH
ncbi:hypothetical protein AHF37_05622 [Paragonimus kellicotti]|nr:hypothetical protein AHF37_05622 [Paragonimus kellicotti]